MHAEVLARRSFRRYLYDQAELALQVLNSRHRAAPHRSPSDENLEGTRRKALFTWHPVSQKLRTAQGVSWHLYTSTAPCGNACVRRWVKQKRPDKRFPLLEVADGWPDELASHTPKVFHAVAEGQISVRMKGEQESGAVRVSSLLRSCSAKICKWNAIGLQGGALSAILTEPIKLSTITVGRKFNRKLCERALCCRLEPRRAKMERARANAHRRKARSRTRGNSEKEQKQVYCFLDVQSRAEVPCTS